MRLRTLLTATIAPAALAASLLVTTDASADPPDDSSAGHRGDGGGGSARIRTPGSFTGYAFDTCVSPPSHTMDRWRRTSPFSAVGIYISGQGRACPARRQPYLSPRWVDRQHERGWRILPLHVGLQAPCFQAGDPTPTKPRMSRDRAAARHQGRHAAEASMHQAQRFGIGRHSVLYLDMEWYDRSRRECDRAVLSFAHGWSRQLHGAGFRAGLYSSGSAAIRSLDVARHRHPRQFEWPDQLWTACSDCRPVGDVSPYLRDDYWRGSHRLHQYALGVRARYGGISYTIDRDWLDVGHGSRAKKPTGTCGRRLDWRHYPRLSRGDHGGQVQAVQCLLRRQDFLFAKPSRHFGAGVERAVKRLQRARGLPVSGEIGRRSWVSLVAAGGDPLVKVGSDSRAVWRLQRAMVAAGHRCPVNGLFGPRTADAVRGWQHATGRPRTGVVTGRQWRALRHGDVT